jgi:branched-chain amino acid transport system permease protein
MKAPKRLDRRERGWIAIAVVAVALLVLAPGGVSAYQLDLLTSLMIYVALAGAWNILGGFGGQFSLVHGAFVGSGAYTLTMLLLHTSLPVLPCVLAAGLLAAGLGAIFAIPLLRLRGVYFTVGSLAIAVGAQAWMANWSYTGASRGLSIPLESLPTPETLYDLALGVAVSTVLVAAAIKYSRFGLRLMAVRDDEEAAAGLGVNGTAVKLTAFAISALLTGTAGSIFALQQVNIEPFSAFSLTWTISMVVMCIVGGLGTLPGPIVGAVLVYYVLQVELQDYETLGTAITGLLLIVVVRFAPEGLVGLCRSLTDKAVGALRGRRDRAESNPDQVGA